MFQSDYLTVKEIDHMFRQALRHHELQRLATYIEGLAGAPDNGQLALAEAALVRLKMAYQAAVPAGVPVIEGELVAPAE